MNMKPIFYLILFTFFLTSCSVPKFMKPSKISKNTPVNAKERALKNVEEGRGISLKGLAKSRSGSRNYEFSTSNPLWRSSLEILDFLPLTTVDYSGGIIITDWYSDSTNGESIKITVRFLSNEIRSDSLKIIIHNKNCQINASCKIVVSNSKIKEEIQRSILTKAIQFKENARNKK